MSMFLVFLYATTTMCEIKGEEEFSMFIHGDGLRLVHFSAEWSDLCKNFNALLFELEKSSKDGIAIGIVEAEELPELSSLYKITAAPTVIFFKKGTELDRVVGYDPGKLKGMIKKYAVIEVPACDNSEEKLKKRLTELINQSRVMLFMNGTPDHPECANILAFQQVSVPSKEVVDILNNANIDYGSFNVLNDEEVRQGLIEYRISKTYPQLYVDGELVGGLDAIKKIMHDSKFLEKLPKKVPLNDRLKALINQSQLMLFMKGTPEQPQCRYSRQIIEMLKNVNASYESFNILKDDTVRQGLKQYSNWPTYPQLYLNGELLGGVDVFADLIEEQEFVDKLPKRA